MIEFIFLDLDDTILDFRWAERQAITRTLSEADIEPTEEVRDLYRRINWEHWLRMERGELTREELKVRRFEALLQQLNREGDALAMSDRYLEYLGQGHCFLPGALETLQTLAQNYRLFLVTNGNPPVQYSRLASAGISHYFEKIFISMEIGFHKPQKEFFDHCFSEIPGFSRERSIIVGDSLSSDIQGGINAGITTCWINYHGRPARDDIQPDYRIDELPQLLPILTEIK